MDANKDGQIQGKTWMSKRKRYVQHSVREYQVKQDGHTPPVYNTFFPHYQHKSDKLVSPQNVCTTQYIPRLHSSIILVSSHSVFITASVSFSKRKCFHYHAFRTV
jgi:hypothetical protein